MKKITLVCLLCVFWVGGAFVLYHLGSDNNPTIMQPEGYSMPEDYGNKKVDENKTTKQIRIKSLDIDDNVYKYYDKTLELVALAPGSGWLKIKTRDGLSPTIRFSSVSYGDIKKFNRFSKRLNMPIRVSVSGNTLSISAHETEESTVFLADKSSGEKRIGGHKMKGFYRPKDKPKLVMRRNKNGNIVLVSLDKDQQQEKRHLAVKKVKNKGSSQIK